MVIQFSERTLMGLGDAPPIISYTKTNKIAEPDTTLEADGSKKGRKVDWTCNDWVLFHKAMVKFFMEGRFASKIKYSQADATANANQVFRQHWDRASWMLARCGYTSDFVAYFKSVGLGDLFNLLQKGVDSGKTTAAKVATSVSNTAVNVIDSTGKIIDNVGGGISNITGMAKYLVPVTITGVVLIAGTYVYKNYIKGNSRVKAYGVEV